MASTDHNSQQQKIQRMTNHPISVALSEQQNDALIKSKHCLTCPLKNSSAHSRHSCCDPRPSHNSSNHASPFYSCPHPLLDASMQLQHSDPTSSTDEMIHTQRSGPSPLNPSLKRVGSCDGPLYSLYHNDDSNDQHAESKELPSSRDFFVKSEGGYRLSS